MLRTRGCPQASALSTGFLPAQVAAASRQLDTCTMCPMTTHPDTEPPSATPERISGPGDLIAAIPSFLGFVPHRSLIVTCLDPIRGGAQGIGTVMRHDLDLPERGGTGVTEEMADVIERYALFCDRNDVRLAVALIVDDRAVVGEDGTSVDRRYRAVAQRLTEVLRRRGTVMAHVLLTPRIVNRERWTAVLGSPGTGHVADPDISPIAIAHIVEGRVVHESRSALQMALEPVSTSDSKAVLDCLEHVRGRDTGSDRRQLETVLAQIGSWAAVDADRPAVIELDALRAAQFGIALRSVMVRDSLLAITLTEVADIAEQLWIYLMRMLPAPERACPAALLGFSAYARGNGALATLAIDIALDADPDYSLAKLLDRSLLAGARPEMIREVALSGYAVAELCGVRLPPPLD